MHPAPPVDLTVTLRTFEQLFLVSLSPLTATTQAMYSYDPACVGAVSRADSRLVPDGRSPPTESESTRTYKPLSLGRRP